MTTKVERRNPLLLPLVPESLLDVPEPMLDNVPEYVSYEIDYDVPEYVSYLIDFARDEKQALVEAA